MERFLHWRGGKQWHTLAIMPTVVTTTTHLSRHLVRVQRERAQARAACQSGRNLAFKLVHGEV